MKTKLLFAASLLALASACSRGPQAPVVAAAGQAGATAVAAPSAEAQAAFLKRVQAALKSGKPDALLALNLLDGASERARGMVPALMRQQVEDCAGKGSACVPTLEPSAKFAGMALTAPAFGELVITKTADGMQTRAKYPVGVKDGKVVLVTEAAN